MADIHVINSSFTVIIIIFVNNIIIINNIIITTTDNVFSLTYTETYLHSTVQQWITCQTSLQSEFDDR